MVDQQAGKQRQHVPDGEHVDGNAFGEIDKPGEQEKGYVEEGFLHLLEFDASLHRKNKTA